MADPRYATEDQITEVATYASGITEYQAKFANAVKAIAGYLEALSPASGIETRYITSEGADDEVWRGHLLSASIGNTVDLWCLTITMSQGLTGSENEIGAFNKPWSLAVDYFYDYDFGTDEENTETDFNATVDAFEYVLEQLRVNPDSGCLPDCCQIESWLGRRMIKRFTDASTHIAKYDIALRFNGL